ncbi:hypothetical protein TYRP_000761 [Tyrophagus putrescentiae]|nr:hypothetical protein TYRP_000761 [Tyrophagus putrescentiae]
MSSKPSESSSSSLNIEAKEAINNNNTKNNNISATSSGVENASEDVDSSSSSYMIYYLLGGIYVRPVGFIESGFISETLQNTKPYQLRRSSGELQIVPYQATDRAMRADYEYVLERNIAPGNVHYHEITVKAGAQLQLFGELFGGYCLQGPATVSVNGRLCIAHNEESALLAEEGLLSNVEVEVNTGSAALYVCDQKALVLVYSAGEPGALHHRPARGGAGHGEGDPGHCPAQAGLQGYGSHLSGRRVASLKQNFTGKSSDGKKTTTLPASELYRKKLLSLQQKSLKQFKSVASKTSSWKTGKHTPEGYQNKQQMPPLVMTKSKAVVAKTVKTVKTLKPVPSSPSAGKKVSTSRIEDDDRLLIPAVREASNNNQDSLLLLQSSVGNLPQPIARAVSTRALQSGVAVLPPSSGAGGVHSLFPQNTGDAEVDEVLRQIAGNLNTTTSNSNISSGKQPSSSSQTSLATIPEEDYGKYSGGRQPYQSLKSHSQQPSSRQQQQQQKAQQQKQQQLAFLREQEHFYRALLQQQKKKNCAQLKLVAKPEEKEEEEDQPLEPSSSEEQLLARQQKLIAGQKALLAAFEAEPPLPKEEPPPLQKLVNTAEETAAEHRANRYAVQVLLGTIASLMVIAAALFAFRDSSSSLLAELISLVFPLFNASKLLLNNNQKKKTKKMPEENKNENKKKTNKDKKDKKKDQDPEMVCICCTII